ncbi:DUF1641 domain-containing protein [Alkalihalobacillus pseudalcaliphilus]|uniref:DUF1641 domain-containing protein n=1 Tax=Alkalihalobacillus pseudalcaliphilus TaxID=79884 RepID=UPI00069CC572|nr:DUF1641 domain-containing protein [Alkalihalobacillus pseudalcaliphilus]
MAKATTTILKQEVDPKKQREKELRELEDLLVNNKEAITQLSKGLQLFNERKLFEMVNATVERGDEVLHRIVTAVDNPNATKSLKNSMLLFETLGKINVDELEPVVLKVNNGISKVGEYEHKNKAGGGYLSLLRSLKDPEVIEGLNILLTLVKGIGMEQEDEEKVRPQKERLVNPQREMEIFDEDQQLTEEYDRDDMQEAEKEKEHIGKALKASGVAIFVGAGILLGKFVWKKRK